jgi:hypothetical protein
MSDKPKKKVGAPTKKTPELLQRFCDGVALGKSSRAMCEEIGISQPTLWYWLANDEEFLKQYTRAKEVGCERLFDEIIEIADDSRFDKREDKDGREITDHEVVNRSRLRVDARKWYLSKIVPKKYGDKVINTHEGGDPSNPILQHITVSFVGKDSQK